MTSGLIVFDYSSSLPRRFAAQVVTSSRSGNSTFILREKERKHDLNANQTPRALSRKDLELNVLLRVSYLAVSVSVSSCYKTDQLVNFVLALLPQSLSMCFVASWFHFSILAPHSRIWTAQSLGRCFLPIQHYSQEQFASPASVGLCCVKK